MKAGKRDEAEARRKEVNELKERIAELDQQRDQAETRMHDLISTLPNIPHESVPSVRMNPPTSKFAAGALNRNLTSSPEITSILALLWVFWILNGQAKSPRRVLRF